MLLPRARIHRWVYPIALAAIAVIAVAAVWTDLLSLKDLVTPMLSLFGTFLGATFAFRLSEEREERKLRDAQREALNRSSFVLIRQANAIDQLVRDFERFPALFLKAFNMPAFKPPSYEALTHNLADLDFLIDSSNPGLLMELAIEQERFHQALESLRIRNEFYVDEVQPALEKLGLNRKTVSVEEMSELLGERCFEGAMNGADNAWQHLSASSLSIPSVHQALLKEAKILFPGRKFITYERVA